MMTSKKQRRRKKWTEEEERTLISSCAALLSSSSSLCRLRARREKRLQPVADRINSLHHLRDPSSFPFRWSWRDVSVKLHNMRHQYLNVKLKLKLNPSPDDAVDDGDDATHLWPNFYYYQQVFGDHQLKPSNSSDPDLLPREEIDRQPSITKKIHGREVVTKKIADLVEVLVNRGSRSKQRECESAAKEMERRRRRRKWEERMEEDEMEWRETVIEMQVEHDRRMMQMHADACAAQLHAVGALARVVFQFIGPGAGGGDGGDGGFEGLAHNVIHGLHQQNDQE